MVESSSSLYTLQNNKTIDGKVLDTDELLSYGRYFGFVIAHLRFYVNPGKGYIKTIVSQITFIKSYISVRKIISSRNYLHD